MGDIFILHMITHPVQKKIKISVIKYIIMAFENSNFTFNNKI